jgi:hypothetical protein
MIYLFGHTPIQCRMWAHWHGLEQSDYKVVTRIDDLRGVQGVIVVLPGHYMNSNYESIYEVVTYLAASKRMVVCYVGEEES